MWKKTEVKVLTSTNMKNTNNYEVNNPNKNLQKKKKDCKKQKKKPLNN